MRWSCKPKVPSSNLGGGFQVQSNLTPLALVSARLPPGRFGLSGLSVLTSHSFTGLPSSPALPVSAASTCIHLCLALSLSLSLFIHQSSLFMIFFGVVILRHIGCCASRGNGLRTGGRRRKSTPKSTAPGTPVHQVIHLLYTNIISPVARTGQYLAPVA